MTKKLMVAVAVATVSLCVSATDVLASSSPVEIKPSFDCGELSLSQLSDLQNKTTSTGLRELAKQCDQQAEDYELKATDALHANSKADVSFLREKAANAYMNVAVFTNSSLFKN